MINEIQNVPKFRFSILIPIVNHVHVGQSNLPCLLQSSD